MTQKKFNKIIVIIFLITITLSITLIPTGIKCIRTAFQLNSISFQIMQLNEAAHLAKPGYGWPPERVEKYNALQAEREALYSSSDNIVSGFANFGNFAQCFILIGLILFEVLGVISSIILFLRITNKIKKKRKRG